MDYKEFVSQLNKIEVSSSPLPDDSGQAELIDCLMHDMPLVQDESTFALLLPEGPADTRVRFTQQLAAGIEYCCSKDVNVSNGSLIDACYRMFVDFPCQMIDGEARERLIAQQDLFIAAPPVFDDDVAEEEEEQQADVQTTNQCDGGGDDDDEGQYESMEGASSVDLGQLFIAAGNAVAGSPAVSADTPADAPWDALLEQFVSFLPLSHVSRHPLDQTKLAKLLAWSRGRPCHGLYLELIIRRCVLVPDALQELHKITSGDDDDWFSVLASCCVQAKDYNVIYCRQCMTDRALPLIAGALRKAKKNTALTLSALHRCYPALKFFSRHGKDANALLASRVMQALALLLGSVGPGVREEVVWVTFRLCASHEALARYMLQVQSWNVALQHCAPYARFIFSLVYKKEQQDNDYDEQCTALLRQQVDLIESNRRHGIAGSYRCVKAMLLVGGGVPLGCKPVLLLGKERVLAHKSDEWQRAGPEQKYLKKLKSLLSNKQE